MRTAAPSRAPPAAEGCVSEPPIARRKCRLGLPTAELLTEVSEVREQVRTSWQIVIDQPEPLVIGLFVRDVAGLKTRHTWLPHCAPGITRANDEGSEEAARRWDLWWDRSISNNWNAPDQSQEQLAGMWWIPPDFESLRSAQHCRRSSPGISTTRDNGRVTASRSMSN